MVVLTIAVGGLTPLLIVVLISILRLIITALMSLMALMVIVAIVAIVSIATVVSIAAIVAVHAVPVLILRIHRIVHDPKIVLRMLQVRFRKYPVPRRLCVSGQPYVLFVHLMSIAAHATVGAVAVKIMVLVGNSTATLATVRTATRPPCIGTWSHYNLYLLIGTEVIYVPH